MDSGWMVGCLNAFGICQKLSEKRPRKCKHTSFIHSFTHSFIHCLWHSLLFTGNVFVAAFLSVVVAVVIVVVLVVYEKWCQLKRHRLNIYCDWRAIYTQWVICIGAVYYHVSMGQICCRSCSRIWCVVCSKFANGVPPPQKVKILQKLKQR